LVSKLKKEPVKTSKAPPNVGAFVRFYEDEENEEYERGQRQGIIR
jgi:hypothetical protein